MRRPTYADLEALPPGQNGEILGGELVVSPRPAPRCAQATTQLAMCLAPMQTGRWRILFEPQLSLDVDLDFDPVIPDLAGWQRTTLPVLPDTVHIHEPPDWVCEVIAPHTARHDRALKLPFYARAGVGHVWLLDPLAQTLEVYALDGDGWRLVRVLSERDAAVLPPFDGLELQLARLWPAPAEPSSAE